MKKLLFASLMCTTSICNLHAQNDGQNPSSSSTLINDMDFIIQSYELGLNMVMFSNLAKTQSSSIVLQDYATMMETHHNKINEDLQTLANENNIVLSTQLPIEFQTLYETMKIKSDKEFDTAYLDKMIEDHQNLILLYENKLKGGQNEQILSWIQMCLPKFKQSLNNALELQMELQSN